MAALWRHNGRSSFEGRHSASKTRVKRAYGGHLRMTVKIKNAAA
jgi:hypothetical protein